MDERSGGSRSPRPLRRLPASLAPWFALVLVAVLPYIAAIDRPLLYDDRTLLDNLWLERDAGPFTVFGTDFWHGTRHEGSDLYRPLTVLTLAASLRLPGGRLGIRLVNLALHASATLLVAAFLRAVARAGRPPGELPALPALPFTAWAGAALFGVHPLGSEAVLWASGRAETLAAMLGLAAFVLWSGARDRGKGTGRIACAAAFFAGALLAKESAACWIPVGLAWAWLVPTRASRRLDASAAVAAAGVLAAYLVLRGSAVSWETTTPPFLDNPLTRAGVLERATNGILLHVRYLAKMAIPATLTIDYGFAQIRPVPVLPFGLAGAVGATVVWVAALLRLRATRVAAAFLLAFVLLAFIVTGNFLLPIGTIFAERLAYLPLAGFCGLAALALGALSGRGLRVTMLGVALAACAVRTVVRTVDYRGVVALTEATAHASPRSVKALTNVGRMRLEILHRPAEAIPPLERALEIWPEARRAARLLEEARGNARQDPSGDLQDMSE